MSLSDDDRRALLRSARESIRRALAGEWRVGATRAEGELGEPRGVFVTLHLAGELRGCIGYIEPVVPLAQAVEEVAIKSAVEDPRFPPLTSRELARVEIEISVLSPLRQVLDVGQIEPGKHGVVISAGYRRGLLLPQVATEYGWGREQFLSHTCLKAGLPPDSWKEEGVEIYSFTTDIFSERDLRQEADHAHNS